jgi:CheY-like chemotaxis protein
MSLHYILLPLLTPFLLHADASLEVLATQDDEFTTLIALFGLGIIAIFALFLSSEKIKLFQKEYKEKEEIESKKHQVEDEILSKMGKDIYNIAKEQYADKSETQLLTITTNLIEFLRIKSNKVEVVTKKLNIANLLNDVSGTLKTNSKEDSFELIYDIDQDIEQTIYSDTLNLSKILVNILLFCVEKHSNSITLMINKTSLSSHNDQLSFTIKTDLKMDVEENIDIFDANYNEETDTYDSLGIFIAKELSKLMKGDLVARDNSQGLLEFVFSIPYIQEQHNTKITKKKLDTQNILIIESTQRASEHLKNILINLDHRVTTLTQEQYLSDLRILHKYDILFLDESLFVERVVDALKTIDIQIVATYNIFHKQQEFKNSQIADIKISKPLTHWQVEDILQMLKRKKSNHLQEIKTSINSGNMPVYKNSFQITRNVTLGSFIQFKDKKVLLVEDNLINQKVFTGILGKSQMEIVVANHGEEALDILKHNHNFDIIFMDINMPVMDGYSAAIAIRKNNKYDDIPIVALSALTSNDEVAKMFTSGMNAYISKPLKKEILFTVLLMFINKTTNKEIILESKEEKLPTFDGLDISIGISKSASNEIFYKEILIEFKDAYINSDQILEKYLADFRYEQLRILATDIKGLTGTIGAVDLNVTATNIIKSVILKKYDKLPDLLKKYKIELNILNNSIDRYLSSKLSE